MSNLKKLFEENQKEICKSLQKLAIDYKIEKKNSFFGGSSLSLAIINFLYNKDPIKKLDVIKISSLPNLQPLVYFYENQPNTNYINYLLCQPQNPQLFSSLGHDIIKTFFNMNYQMIMYNHLDNTLVTTPEFLYFLEEKIVYSVTSRCTFNDLLFNIHLASIDPEFKMNNEENYKKFVLSILGAKGRMGMGSNMSPDKIIPLNDRTASSCNNTTSYFPQFKKYINKISTPHFDIINDTVFYNTIKGVSHPFVVNARYNQKEVFNWVIEKSDWLNNGSESDIEKRSILTVSGILNPYIQSKKYNFYATIDLLIKHDFNRKQLLELMSFLNGHQGFSQLTYKLVENNWTTQSIIDFYSKVKSEKLSFIGFIESSVSHTTFELKIPKNVTSDNSNEAFKEIKSQYEEDRKKKDRVLVTALDISDFEYKHHLKELTTALSLEDEGSDMNHCVGGYSKVLSSSRRIFHVNKKNKSTVELASNRMNKWTIIQHKGHSNSEPSKDNHNVINAFIQFLNNKNEKNKNSDFKGFAILSKILLNQIELTSDFKACLKKAKEFKNIKELSLDKEFQDLIKKLEGTTFTCKCVNKEVEESLRSIFDLFTGKSLLFVSINNPKFQNKEDYKKEGFCWFAENKMWWRCCEIKELPELASKLNIDVSLISDEVPQKIIEDLKNFIGSRGVNKLSNTQRVWINAII